MQGFDLACLKFAVVLALHVDLAHRVPERRGAHVLLLGRLELPRLLERPLHEVARSPPRPPQPKVGGGRGEDEPRSRDVGPRARVRLPQFEGVRSHHHLAVGGGEGDDVVEGGQVDRGHFLAPHEVQQQAPQGLVVRRGLVPGLPEEHDAGLGPEPLGVHRPRQRVGRVHPQLQRGERVARLHPELGHVEDVAVEAPAEGQVVGPLLGVVRDREEGAVVLLAQELERGVVLERVHVGVLPLHELAEGLAQARQVLEEPPHPLGGFGPAQEDGLLGVLDHLGRLLLHRARRSGRRLLDFYRLGLF
mmetsp:Transcript_45570/g.102904  ORF Transcript_45570/g.102904 Transcript_45570/m.102904 type:complete len:304 (+) Transcript_45570:208-1119(+)